jgi:hypothetical protein
MNREPMKAYSANPALHRLEIDFIQADAAARRKPVLVHENLLMIDHLAEGGGFFLDVGIGSKFFQPRLKKISMADDTSCIG